MRILVTGRSGQVATSLAEIAGAEDRFALDFLARPDVDFAAPDALAQAVADRSPDLVVNAAAHTAVDQAEDEQELAFTINERAAGEIARGAAMAGAPVIQISTDYVFDGAGEEPWTPFSPTNPTGAYGRSKLAGEEAVAAANSNHLIVRTAWVYSPFGKNFVKTMLRVAESRDELTVVADQFGNPTSALQIARGLVAMFDVVGGRNGFDQWGIYHLTGQGSTSWHGFAEAIFDGARKRGLPHASVKPIGTADYPTKARRPANSRLDGTSFESVFDHSLTPWQDALDEVLDRLAEEGGQAAG